LLAAIALLGGVAVRTTTGQTWLTIAALLLGIGSAATARTIYVSVDARADSRAIVIDHNCVDLSAIGDEYLAPAASLRMLMRHASVGDGINWGLDCLAGSKPTQSICAGFSPGKYDRSKWHLENRGNPGSKAKVDDLVTQTESRAGDFDVFMMKFCYIDALGSNQPDWQYYRSLMEQLEADYPDKVFVWWTIPLTRDGQSGTDLFNAQVRAYCAANGKVLFDIANIECHDPNGTKLTNAAGNEVISQNYTKEIHAGHLNRPGRVRVASALWHLMARLAGWQEQPNTIQAAIDGAEDGDVVIVKPGRYTGDGNRDIDFKGKVITVISEDGPNTCVIDCQGSKDDRHRGFFFHSGETADSVLQGFTITGGFVYNKGGAIYCCRSSPSIRDSIIIRNTAREGGGIACLDSGVTVSGCMITDNLATTCIHYWSEDGCFGSGGGVAIINDYDTGGAELAHCIVTGNRASRYSGGICCGGNAALVGCTISGNRTGESGYGGGIGFNSCYPHCTLKDCIVWGNMASGDEQIILIDDIRGVGRVKILHSVVGDDPNAIQLWGFGADYRSFIEGAWLSLDPLLVRPGYWDPNGTPGNQNDGFWVDGDYHLKSQAGRWGPETQSLVKDDVTSPCIDAGDRNSPIGHEPFPNGGVINMGAYGGTAEASKSFFGEPICETIVAGDINGDCKVDFADLALMAAHWLTENR
jgi:hypothetical protein